MPKNVVFFCDGTGNNKDFGIPTNVARLFQRALDETAGPGGAPSRQKTAYDAGIGAEFGDLVAKTTGSGISQNIRDGYDFIAGAYDPGDRIYLIGFSRGAYTARSIGGMLGLMGLPRRQQAGGKDIRSDDALRKTLMDRAYAIYKTGQGDEQRQERKRKSAEFQREVGYPEHADPRTRAPHFIGVWDTVRSLGVPVGVRDWEFAFWTHRFHDHELNPHVAHAYHALSIDDERLQFLPTIWNEPTQAQKAAEAAGAPNPQSFEQLWFPGVHSDIGGGYGNHELADITLRWMIERAARAGILFKPPFDSDPMRGLTDVPHGEVHDSRPDFWTKLLYPRQPRQVARGFQNPEEKLIAAIGPGLVHNTWRRRFIHWFGTNAAYRPESLAPHPDYQTAQRQMSAGQNPPPGPLRFTV
ncbi:MAG: DUF2235 domain-containing protein [Beijerinckiaceae bacterium]